jgi:hypothetical protein
MDPENGVCKLLQNVSISISIYIMFHRSTKNFASLGYRTCPEYKYIKYILH